MKGDNLILSTLHILIFPLDNTNDNGHNNSNIAELLTYVLVALHTTQNYVQNPLYWPSNLETLF